jgi:Ca-activated chloride channel family protein
MVVVYAEGDGMTLGMPWALLGLLLLPLFWWWGRSSLVTAPVGRKRLSLAARAMIFTLIVIALSDPRWQAFTKDLHVIWLVDASRSVDGEGAKKAAELHKAAGNHAANESWIAFGGRGVNVTGPDKLAEISPESVNDRETNLAGALKLAEASFPPGKVKTIALVTDGSQTLGDAGAAAASLKNAGVKVRAFTAAPPDKPEVLVRAVNAPRQVRSEEPFRVEVEVSSNRETEAEISVFRNGVKVGSRQERLKPGANPLEFTQSLRGDERLVELSAEVKPVQDTIADNNRSSAIVQTEGLSKVLLIADKPEQARYLAWALKQEGIVLDARPATGAPTTLADLQNYDLVILDNVPATSLTLDQMNLLSTYVRDFGGGLLMTGGDQAFGLGGYYRTPVEEILPVRCDFEKEKETPSLGIVFVIDRSGSMSGEKIEMAKEAAKAALELLSDRDYAGVVAFDNEAFWVADLQSASDKGGISQKISSISEGGGTNLAPGMELALQALRSSPAKLRHAILLTDGVSTPGPFYELATQMAGEKITVSTVAVGEDADGQLLEQIAQWGSGRYYLALDPRTVPQIFAKETMTASKSAIQEAPFVPVPVRPADFLGGLNFDRAPFLLGYVTTRHKPTAEVWLGSEKGEPLLATWRYGLGQAGAWTSDARNRWAVEWLRWEGFGKFWAQLVRKLARSEAVRRFPMTLEREGADFVLRADTVDALGRFVGGLDGEATVSAPDGSQLKLPLEKIAPGRYEARWPANQPGAWHAQAVFSRKSEAVERQALSAAAGYPAEFLPRAPDEALLGRLAAETGGTLNGPAEEIWTDDRRAAQEKELWPWLATLALVLFLADVALRRWPRPAPAARPAVVSRPPEPALHS